MAGITTAQAEENLAAYIAADKALAEGAQSYSIQGRMFTKVDAAEITRKIEFYEAIIARNARVGAGGMRARRGVAI